jgi:hypothetical protein
VRCVQRAGCLEYHLGAFIYALIAKYWRIAVSVVYFSCLSKAQFASCFWVCNSGTEIPRTPMFWSNSAHVGFFDLGVREHSRNAATTSKMASAQEVCGPLQASSRPPQLRSFWCLDLVTFRLQSNGDNTKQLYKAKYSDFDPL